MIRLIVAMDQGRGIGYQGQLPWNISLDLRHFKDLTTDQTIIMGRTTYESIGRPLPKRLNVVLTTRPESLKPQDNLVAVSSLSEALRASQTRDTFIIGGSTIYSQAEAHASHIDLTWIKSRYVCDTTFPFDPFLNHFVLYKEDHQDFCFYRLGKR